MTRIVYCKDGRRQEQAASRVRAGCDRAFGQVPGSPFATGSGYRPRSARRPARPRALPLVARGELSGGLPLWRVAD